MKKNLFKDIIIFSSTLQISIINLGIEKTNSIDDEGNKISLKALNLLKAL